MIDDGLTLRAGREAYFREAGITPGYEARWVVLRAGPVPIAFPNTAARVRAVRRHDLHHVLTAYDTTWRGEAEIGAWELASGCGRFLAAWHLNLWALAIGLCLAPRAVLRAFVRGRRSANLYGRTGEPNEALLDRTVGACRATLGLDRPVPPPTLVDRLAFLAWAMGACAYALISVGWPVALLVWWG